MDLRESAGVVYLIKWETMVLGCISFSRSLDHLFIITRGKAGCLAIDPRRWVEGVHLGVFSGGFHFFSAAESGDGGKCYQCSR